MSGRSRMSKESQDQQRSRRQAMEQKFQSLNAALSYYRSKVSTIEGDLAQLKRDLLTSEVPGFKLQKVRKNQTVRFRPAVDFKSLGISTKEAKEKLGGKTIKALLNSSVQFTWRPYTKERQGDEGYTHNGEYYGACERNEQTIVMPFKAWREFWRFITFDQPPRSGLLPPGTNDYWIAVSSCLKDIINNGTFEGLAGVTELIAFIDGYITYSVGQPEGEYTPGVINVYDPNNVANERPQSTLITISNIQYHNLNTAQPTTPINELPMGFFATHLSHQALNHPIQPAETWDDMFVPEPTPKSFEGLEAVCVFKGLVNAITSSFLKRAEKNGYNQEGSFYRIDFRFLWDLVHNTRVGEDGTIYERLNGRNYVNFIDSSEPDYYPYEKAADPRITLKQAEVLFHHFAVTVVVIDDNGNEVYRFDRPKDPEWRSHITFVAKNGHLYLCPDCKSNTAIARLQQQAPGSFNDVRLSDKFRLPKNVEPCGKTEAITPKVRKLLEGKDMPAEVAMMCAAIDAIKPPMRVLYDGNWQKLPDFIARSLSTSDATNYQIFVPSRKEDAAQATPDGVASVARNKTWTNDLLPLFYHLMHKKQFQAEIGSLRDRTFGRLRLRNFVREGSKEPVSVTIQAMSPNVKTIEEEDQLQAAKDMLFRKIFTQQTMSSLSDAAKDWYKDVIGGLIGNLVHDPEGAIEASGSDTVLEIDIKSQHPYALSKIKFNPIMNPFDEPKPYDGHPIDPYTSYHVEWHVPNHCCRNRAKCSGMELMYYKDGDYTITHYLRPSKLVPSHVFDEMMRFNETSDLSEKLRKQATLPICGMLGKCVNSSSSITHFTSKEEALHYRNRYKGSTVIEETIEGHTYWTVQRQTRVEMIEGYRPLYFMMLGMSRLQQWQNIQTIMKKATVLQTVTDAVRFLHPPGAWSNAEGEIPKDKVMAYLGLADQMVDNTLKKKIEKLLALGVLDKEQTEEMAKLQKEYRKQQVKQIGKLKLDEVPVDKVKGAYTNGTCIFDRFIPDMVDQPSISAPLAPYVAPQRVHQYRLPDEYDVNSTLEWLDKQLKVCPRLFVKGEKPGVGKSALAKLLSDKIKADGGKVLYLAQYWETVLEFAQKGDIQSLYSAFCIAFNGQDLSEQEEVTSKGKGKGTKKRLRKKGINFKNYRMVVIDEIFTADIPSCRRIMQVLIKKFPNLIIISNGDVGQLEPVNTDAINHVDAKQRRKYYEDIIDRMFPHQLLLTKVKRARCQTHQHEYTLPEIRDCPDCQAVTQAYVDMVDDMRSAKDKTRSREVMLRKFKTISRADQIVKAGITSAVSYTNSMAEVVNDIIHTEEARKAGHAGEEYYPGMKLVCKQSMRLAQTADEEDEVVDDAVDEDEEDSSNKKVRTYTNHPYVVVDVRKSFLTLEDTLKPIDGTDPKRFKVSRIKRKNAYRAQIDWFELPYCRTGHGWQGKGNDEKFLILESDHRHVTQEWLVVVATRNINPEDVYVYVGNDLDSMKKKVDHRKHLEMCEREVMRYKRQDLKKFGELPEGYGEDDWNTVLMYPTREQYAILLDCAEGKQCPHPDCQNIIGREPGRHSWDRVNNGCRHWISNCRFVCSLNCNSSMRP